MDESTAAVSWGPDRIDLFWVDAAGALIHRASSGDAWDAPESLGGTPASAPAATAWAVDQLQVFAVFPDGALWNRFWDGEAWHPWESLGGELHGTPAASSWGADRIDVWAPGTDGMTWHRWWNGTRWVEWERLPRSVCRPRLAIARGALVHHFLPIALPIPIGPRDIVATRPGECPTGAISPLPRDGDGGNRCADRWRCLPR